MQPSPAARRLVRAGRFSTAERPSAPTSPDRNCFPLAAGCWLDIAAVIIVYVAGLCSEFWADRLGEHRLSPAWVFCYVLINLCRPPTLQALLTPCEGLHHMA